MALTHRSSSHICKSYILLQPMASAYSAFMPLLANRLPVAINARYSKLAVEILHAMGKLAAAAGAEKVGSDADSLIPSVVGLLSRAEVVEDRDLLRGVHTTLTSLASATGSAFTTYVETILPPLLTSATVEVDFHMEKVEVSISRCLLTSSRSALCTKRSFASY